MTSTFVCGAFFVMERKRTDTSHRYSWLKERHPGHIEFAFSQEFWEDDSHLHFGGRQTSLTVHWEERMARGFEGFLLLLSSFVFAHGLIPVHLGDLQFAFLGYVLASLY